MTNLSKKYSNLAKTVRINNHNDMKRYPTTGTPEDEAVRLINKFICFAPDLQRAKQCAIACIQEKERSLTEYGQNSMELQNMDFEWRFLDKCKEAIAKWEPGEKSPTLRASYRDMEHQLQQNHIVKHQLDMVYAAGQESIEVVLNPRQYSLEPKDAILDKALKAMSAWLLYQLH